MDKKAAKILLGTFWGSGGWKGLYPSSKQERDAILEIWGASGLLVPQDTPRKSRGGYSDFHFAATWQGDDGYSTDAAISLFGSYLPQKL